MTKCQSSETQQIESQVKFTEERSTVEVENKANPDVPKAISTTLKKDDAFLIANESGDFLAANREMGLFWHGTRFLSRCNLHLNRHTFILLSRHIADQGSIVHLDFMNAAFTTDQGERIDQGEIHICRQLELQKDCLIQTFTLTSFHGSPLQFTLGLDIDADFCDIFEVRGVARKGRGEAIPSVYTPDSLTLGYRGLDNIVRKTRISFSSPARQIRPDSATWEMQLERGEPSEVRLEISMQSSDERLRLTEASGVRAEALAEPQLQSDNALFSRLLNYSMHDLVMLDTQTPHGHYPYAGIPWFSAPFGRDGLITSLQFLPWYPQMVRGALAFLAAYQGSKHEPFTDEQPGKILHEFRQGEMANLREIPYIPYYGSIDVTPLFLIALEQYVRWSNDLVFLERLWPNAEAAAHWIHAYGDKDGDHFLEYQTESEKGLSNQGWKDSWDSVSYSDGNLAAHPIALSEVQGYTYAAYRAMAYLAGRLGKEQQSWEQAACTLQQHFWEQFWWEEQQTFYEALDGNKRPCDVVSSNAGQCLWSGIATQEQGEKTIARLMQPDMYSGWGVRTLSAQANRYNPMNYHNGTIWPHDNSMVAAGFARYGGKQEAAHILKGMLDASLYYERGRLPELYCGFPQRQGYGPINYPVACSPQAWAAGAPFLVLSSLLGLQPEAEHGRLVLTQPMLPDWLHSLEMRGMYVGKQHIHLHFTRQGEETLVTPGEHNEAEIIMR